MKCSYIVGLFGNGLESRYKRTGEMKDLEEAIQTAQQGVELTPVDHLDYFDMVHSS